MYVMVCVFVGICWRMYMLAHVSVNVDEYVCKNFPLIVAIKRESLSNALHTG